MLLRFSMVWLWLSTPSARMNGTNFATAVNGRLIPTGVNMMKGTSHFRIMEPKSGTGILN